MKSMHNGNIGSDMQQLIGNTLRWGVIVACAIALVGGVMYIFEHGAEPMKDYSHFSYDAPPQGYKQYTTLQGIVGGVFSFSSTGWIQLGVVALILTPVMRVVLSLFDFMKQRDWLYVAITGAVLSVIVCNSLNIL